LEDPRCDALADGALVDTVRAAASLGVKTIRLTGGEPLLRPRLSELVESVANIRGIEEVSLTTNGVLLADKADRLRTAGLRRVNISLDTADADQYQRITGRDAFSRVLEGIDAALEAGLRPVKVNAVIGLTSDWRTQALSLTQLAVERKLCVRFIERMPTEEGDRLHPPDLEELSGVLTDAFDLTPIEGPPGSGPARYCAMDGRDAMVGLIYPRSAPFCAACNRLRLTAQGQLRPCLFSDVSVDLREALCRPPAERHALLCRGFRLAVLAKPRSHGSFSEARIRNMAGIGG
jgi:cyclic pyranopterin phosphate synthase